MLYLFGDLDPSVSAILRKCLRSGDCFLDVGANVGVESIPAAKICGEGGSVISFEANPNICDLLRKSMVFNGIKNMSVEHIAVSNASKRLFLKVPNGNTGSASLSDEESESVFSVDAISLDSYFKSNRRQVRLMKVDVEGHEYQVLEGARELLSLGRIDNILIEIWNYVDSPVVELLKSYGCVPYQVVKKWSLFTLLRDLRRCRVSKSSCDFLFIKE
jgi:FkbM family methyltransferase